MKLSFSIKSCGNANAHRCRRRVTTSLRGVTAKWVALAGTLVTIGGCGNGSEVELSRSAQIFVVTIQAVLAEQNPAAGTDDLPVVYVEPLGEDQIDAAVQADTAAELRETADVRFADERSEAVEEDEPGMPVRDDGILVAIGDVPEEGDPVDVEVETYRSEDDWSTRLFTFSLRPSGWTVTSTSVVPEL
jgi:hypothetical protein